MTRVKQALVAPSIKFFKERFLKKYDLVEYHDPNEPAPFYGASESSNFINGHNSYKIILPSTPNDIPKLNNYNNTFLICSDNFQLPKNVIRKSITPRLKNYDVFKPNKLGDKIYFYSGFKDGWNLKNGMINEIQKRINYEIITTNHSKINDYYDIEYLKSNYYDKCFLNINLTNGHGMSTVIELGLMGRKTIFRNPNKNNFQRIEFESLISYETLDDIVNIINDESKKINTIQESIDVHNVDDEWLYIDYWIK